MEQAHHDHHHHDHDLDPHHEGLEPRRGPDTQIEQGGDQQAQQCREQIHHMAVPGTRRAQHPVRKVNGPLPQ